MEWGNRLEDVIIDKFADEHPEYVLLRDVGSWAHNERPWQKANPDFLYIDVSGLLRNLYVSEVSKRHTCVLCQIILPTPPVL
jgi:hypothetical protein